MDEKIGAVSEENSFFSEAEGISFSGGSENAFIKEYASSPQVERTIEDIEKEELLVAEKQAEIRERNALRREKEKNKPKRKPVKIEDRAVSEPPKPSEEKEPESSVVAESSNEPPFEAEISNEPQIEADGAFTPAKKLTLADLVTPIFEENDNSSEIPEADSEEKKQASRFARIFSESKGFSALSIINGIALIVWNVLYFVTAFARESLFTNAVNTMLAQGQISYTAVFSSPALTVLKVMAYILPVLILGWVIAFRKTDGKNKSYNKKTIIIIMCLIALTAIVAVFDVAAAHLVLV